MRMSQLFSHTLREVPADAEIASHQLLLRAGYIRQLATGIFSYLPLAQRVLRKIETILRQEMEAIGGQEISMPVIQPADLWQESGRWYAIDAEMGRFKDRNLREMVLAMTHEEVVSDLVRKEVRSYRQLPQLVFHIQTKWRDDPRPRAGLIRAREFTMKDSYSLDADWEGLEMQYQAHYQAYFKIFERCELPVMAVKSDTGMMGGKLAHEFIYLNPIGEDTLIICSECSYAANRQVASFRKPTTAVEVELPLEKVATPEIKTIEDLARYLDIPKSRTAKAVFLMATLNSTGDQATQEASPPLEQFIFVIIRGDMEVNETKLANLLQARSLRPATDEEIRRVGAVPGYASPVGLKVEVVVDDLIPRSPNLVAGANETGYHLRNVNYGRDYQATRVADIASAQQGDACPECSAPLQAVRGVEVGNIFQLGTRYSKAMGCTYTDSAGNEKPVVMGSYGIGLGRLMACIAEEHHDELGLVWPASVAPYQVHLVLLAGKEPLNSTQALGEQLYAALHQAGIETLYDDRLESPGVKFNDADLLGLPVRITISERAYKQGGVEYKRRDQAVKSIIPVTLQAGEPDFSQVIERIRQELNHLQPS